MIPLSVPYINGNEWKYVKDCLDSGWISSAGSYVNQFEQMVAEFVGAKYGVACMNGTAGLHIAQILCGIQEGDVILVPNITFIATLNAISYAGAKPILIDVDPNTWQLDLSLLEKFLIENTFQKKVGNETFTYLSNTDTRVKAIMPVHVLGNMINMNQLIEISKKFNLRIIEDSTESLGSYFDSKHSGTFGDIGVFSFNGNKIISTGGGGVIVTNNEDFAKKAKHLTTQAKTDPMEYIHDEIGYNYRLVNVLAAIGVAQMEEFPILLKNKQNMDEYYRKELQGIGDIKFQKVEDLINPNCWLFTFQTKHMRELLTFLNQEGVQSRPFWKPMNELPMFKNFQYVTESNISSKIYESCISIPSSSGITKDEQDIVISKIKHFYSSL